MKKLLLLSLVSGTLDVCAMETDYKSTKQEETGLQEYIHALYEPNETQKKKTPEEIDAENKEIIYLFDLFAEELTKEEPLNRYKWCETMIFFTTDIMLTKAKSPSKSFSTLQKIFLPMKGHKKGEWQMFISDSFEHMPEQPYQANFFSNYIKKYLKADIIVSAVFNEAHKIGKLKIQKIELIDELMRLYKDDLASSSADHETK